MSTRRRAVDDPLTAEVWRRLLGFVMKHHQENFHVLGELGLTPGDMKALFALDRHEPRPMRALAAGWACDASNVTWMVDRLEERGLVERRTSTADRRVKTVVLTAEGEATKATLIERFQRPPDEFRDLSRRDLEGLRALLAQLPTGVPPWEQAATSEAAS